MLSTRQKRRTPLRYFVLPVVTAMALSYFFYQAFEGDYGLREGERLNAKVASLQSDLERISARRKQLELQANLLRDGSIERDMIEERVRAILGKVDSQDVVILR